LHDARAGDQNSGLMKIACKKIKNLFLSDQKKSHYFVLNLVQNTFVHLYFYNNFWTSDTAISFKKNSKFTWYQNQIKIQINQSTHWLCELTWSNFWRVKFHKVQQQINFSLESCLLLNKLYLKRILTKIFNEWNN